MDDRGKLLVEGNVEPGGSGIEQLGVIGDKFSEGRVDMRVVKVRNVELKIFNLAITGQVDGQPKQIPPEPLCLVFAKIAFPV